MRLIPVFCRSLLAGDFTGEFYISPTDHVLNRPRAGSYLQADEDRPQAGSCLQADEDRPQAGSYLRTNESLIGLFASRRQIGNLSLHECVRSRTL